MLTRLLKPGWLVWLLLVTSIAFAETGYVTDELSLGLHKAGDTSDTAFRYLKSGDSFEVLSRDRYYAEVRLPDGTTGYVKINYVVFDKPARLIVKETAEERDQLATELDKLKAAFAEPARRMETLEQEAEALRAERDQAVTTATALQESNAALLKKQDRYRYSLPYTWVAGAMLVCLLAGGLLGHWWVDHQSRRRHGGIRVV